ncbi:metal dependent phosphohydrolase [Thermoclostridium stercorarium subsp. stercorarium DSM 8532]|jgi:predicted HD superfamily hydrolase involved in NAD metabolism|uniref:bis(5'-nucleosyl)-tetraphosphatase (symmetrical) n=2 Tax=Thermoclostridium stercorarium TaxID=1510 RepID=L7VN85_THES1|nr:bis(5'-nucleosyl)-tetraphosphatase (symmetrical) YqeK [Thermoclostridium stercorarium]AGC68212.1 metal dependent phosphohydrolase [Thermoclostridium stercorarium subsp. stercorarium DSM 8532]AGI39242.1 hydrolase [Thermoclostridium stercorarium subsp. stercorarium DSM 8532]ANX01119.1 phosphohydrolase [Thermoclostridium stercorarium subsp. leptospartum DSM 9219]UZQ86739.1 bis(5'-nucleosyl)-tetraphosphatase (symmetrical) YqeK [Thermoclostridium stercorarium]
MNIYEMKRKLKENLTEKRYIHSLNVMEEAVRLANRYGADVEKARIAGLLHDCAKNVGREKEDELIKKYGIETDEIQKHSHALMHSILGKYIAREEYGIYDEEILNAIYWHTTGRPGMTMLEKIIFVADFIEPGRDFDMAKKAREYAYKDLNRCIVMCADATIMYLLDSGKLIHPYTLETRNDAILALLRKSLD